MMNFFRFTGDMAHLASFFILLQRMRVSRSCIGISYKTQEMYLLVFVTRYLDLFLYTVSWYNTFMKLAFIGLNACIVYLMRFHKLLRLTNDKVADDFNHWTYLLPGAAILALLFTDRYSLVEVLWTFSIFLEAVAILPQLFLLRKLKKVENLTSHYVFSLGAYRTLYILNWIYRYYDEGFWEWTIVIPGVVQSLLYVDFFYYYIIAQLTGKPVTVEV